MVFEHTQFLRNIQSYYFGRIVVIAVDLVHSRGRSLTRGSELAYSHCLLSKNRSLNRTQHIILTSPRNHQYKRDLGKLGRLRFRILFESLISRSTESSFLGRPLQFILIIYCQVQSKHASRSGSRSLTIVSDCCFQLCRIRLAIVRCLLQIFVKPLEQSGTPLFFTYASHRLAAETALQQKTSINRPVNKCKDKQSKKAALFSQCLP